MLIALNHKSTVMKQTILSILAVAATVHFLNAQTVKVPDDLGAWDTVGVTATIETYKGKQSIFLKSGSMSVKGADLRDGIIEADISFSAQRGFPGFVFRMQDPANLESFYLRPHQSGNPDATQYTPVFNGQAGWQLYHGEGYSKAFRFNMEQWHHIKIDFHGLQAEVYIDDMEKPLIKVKELLCGWKSGKIGVSVGGTPIHLANFQYTAKQGSQPAAIPVPATGTNGLVTQWQVSNVLPGNQFEKMHRLPSAFGSTLKWTTQHTEASGTINLARFGQWTETNNTIIAKLMVESDADQIKPILFGFSDFVRVYLNGQALYSGADNFLSRDYRFLGTIGYFDGLFLPLKKGTNELWFVVGENFGGWGLRMKFEDMKGIRLK
jgi:hypothetical protein